MADKPTLTLRYLKEWTRDSKVPGGALLKDGQERAILWITREDDMVIFDTVFGSYEPRTLDDLLRWAEANDLPGDTRLIHAQNLFPIVDLNHWTDGPGADYLILQTVYG